ncbi:isoleucine--tRNA ligase [Candidatus Woesearchaeota archaeon]|nr:isoleucine--tRNA ligase [Candidatus Woesearchaeota archaeon]
MKFPSYKHAEIEPELVRFWAHHQIIDKLNKKNKKGENWCFLQGPPYTSGRVHLGTAWNTVLKDMALRYKRMQGFNVWDRNGYDVHGLPTEHKVMAKFDLKTKEDIEKFGVGKFVEECIKFAIEMGDEMTKDFLRMGSTLDYTDTYMALKNDYMEGEWWLVKQAWKKKRLYLGEKVMTWCAHCETALAKHECEYAEVTDDSIFLKFKVKGKENEYLLIWTTTPWTIPFNLGVMVNPELDYVRAKVENEVWILGKSLAAPVIQSVADKKMEIIEEFKGADLEGLEYEHPWFGIIPGMKELKEEYPNIHTVVLSKQYVDFTAGTGLVHMAPGCGPEDYEVGREYNIPPYNNLSAQGEFPADGPFTGRIAKKNDDKFIEDLGEAGVLIASTPVEHEYPHCWRCHEPVIFKTTKQWFFKIEDLKEVMIEENKKVNWVPQTQAFDAWTTHLRDNSITRQRVWGTPVPIWKCSNCENIEVIGSIKELKEKAGKVPENLHIPWIDEVEWTCKCHGKMKRIPDIIDVWIDAGTASWNCLYYPQRKDYLDNFFPVDFILEATEQVRLWFSMLSICSQLGFGKNCYKNVYMHGMLTDVEGRKMSKSLGNIISPYEVIDKHGADVLRYYTCGTNAGQEMRFSWDEIALKERHLNVLWNIHKLLISLAKENGWNPYEMNLVPDLFDIEEKYILSRLNQTIKKVTELFDDYKLDETILPIEELFLDLSRNYVQMIREKSAVGSKAEKENVVYVLGHVLFETLKMFAPIAPFITEAIFLNLKEEFNLKEESIHHWKWPVADDSMIDLELEMQMNAAGSVIQSILNAREKINRTLRWPCKEVVVVSQDETVCHAVSAMSDVIKKQTNVKEIVVQKKMEGVSEKLKSDYNKIGPAFGALSPKIIAKLAMESPQSILKHIDEENGYKFKVDGQEVCITRDHLMIEKEVPYPYKESEFKHGFVYLSQEVTDALEAEGFARELMRRVQQLRKKEGLEKTDKIVLFIKMDKDLLLTVGGFENDIKAKCGAEKIKLSEMGPAKKHAHCDKFKIKGEEFEVWFDKV